MCDLREGAGYRAARRAGCRQRQIDGGADAGAGPGAVPGAGAPPRRRPWCAGRGTGAGAGAGRGQARPKHQRRERGPLRVVEAWQRGQRAVAEVEHRDGPRVPPPQRRSNGHVLSPTRT